MEDSVGKCNICNDTYTSTHVEIAPGEMIYVCAHCMEKAKDNFIWLCMSCGKVYLRPKSLVIKRVKDYELKRAYMLCEDMQIIQGIEACITCSPEMILDYMEEQQVAMEC